MIRARAECIGSRVEIGASDATVGLRAATDFSTAIGARRAKAEFRRAGTPRHRNCEDVGASYAVIESRFSVALKAFELPRACRPA